MISRVRMRRRLSGVSQQRRQQLAAAKTGGDLNPLLRERGGRGWSRKGPSRGDEEGWWRKGRRKQINTGEQEGPANERTDAKSSADQRRDASQSPLSCLISSVPSSFVSSNRAIV